MSCRPRGHPRRARRSTHRASRTGAALRRTVAVALALFVSPAASALAEAVAARVKLCAGLDCEWFTVHARAPEGVPRIDPAVLGADALAATLAGSRWMAKENANPRLSASPREGGRGTRSPAALIAKGEAAVRLGDHARANDAFAEARAANGLAYGRRSPPPRRRRGRRRRRRGFAAPTPTRARWRRRSRRSCSQCSGTTHTPPVVIDTSLCSLFLLALLLARTSWTRTFVASWTSWPRATPRAGVC